MTQGAVSKSDRSSDMETSDVETMEASRLEKSSPNISLLALAGCRDARQRGDVHRDQNNLAKPAEGSTRYLTNVIGMSSQGLLHGVGDPEIRVALVVVRRPHLGISSPGKA